MCTCARDLGHPQLSTGNLIGQHGGSGRPSVSDRKAEKWWIVMRGSSCCPTLLILCAILITGNTLICPHWLPSEDSLRHSYTGIHIKFRQPPSPLSSLTMSVVILSTDNVSRHQTKVWHGCRPTVWAPLTYNSTLSAHNVGCHFDVMLSACAMWADDVGMCVRDDQLLNLFIGIFCHTLEYVI